MVLSTLWSDYFIAVTALLAVYYILFAFKFFGPQIKAVAGSSGASWWKPPQQEYTGIRDQPKSQTSGFESTAGEVGHAHFTQGRFEFDQIVGLGNQLTALIEEAYQQSYDATELSLLLQMVLKDYPLVHGNAFRDAINEFIDNQCAKYDSLHLGEADMAVIWDQV